MTLRFKSQAYKYTVTDSNCTLQCHTLSHGFFILSMLGTQTCLTGKTGKMQMKKYRSAKVAQWHAQHQCFQMGEQRCGYTGRTRGAGFPPRTLVLSA